MFRVIIIAAIVALTSGGAVAQPAPKQAPGYGTLFGYVPDDGRAAPINELLSHIRAAIFCGLIVPGFCRPVQG